MLKIDIPEKAKNKNISIYPKTEKYLIKLAKKYKVSQSKIIAEAINKLVENEGIEFIEHKE